LGQTSWISRRKGNTKVITSRLGSTRISRISPKTVTLRSFPQRHVSSHRNWLSHVKLLAHGQSIVLAWSSNQIHRTIGNHLLRPIIEKGEIFINTSSIRNRHFW
jgi:hypothetical protein